MFSAGKKVEVSFEKEDYREAWFPATVLEDAGHGSFLVEYQHQGVDDISVLHQLTVDNLHIRPSPPHLRDKNFDLLEKVDAYFDFGWWSGVITKELADSRYIVFFKHTNKEKELNYSELRPHMDWKDGKWFSSSQRSKRGKGGETSNQLIDGTKKPGRPPRSPQGTLGESAENIVEIPVVIALESNGVKNARLKRSDTLASPRSSAKQTSGQKEQLADSRTPTSVKERDIKNPEEGTVSTQKRKRGRPPKVLTQGLKISTAVNKQNGDAAPNLTAAEDCLKKKVSSPTSLGTESVVKDVPIPDKEHLKLVGDNTPKQKNTISSVIKLSFTKTTKLPEEEIAETSAEQPKMQSPVRGKRGRRRTISVNTEASNHDSQDVSKENIVASSENDGPSRKDNVAVDVLPSTVLDDQPLSTWIDGTHSPTIVDLLDPFISLGISTEEHIEASERAATVVSQASPLGGASVGEGDIEGLPFVKNTPLWETIESMEVLQMIPQKPHFRPLNGMKESSREGLAIGSVVTFIRVVEKTCELQFHDPKSTIEDYLETLVELEGHGFNVKVVRDRLMGLLLFKSKHEELHKQSNEIRSRIVEQSVETSKVDEEIDEIDKKIKELEEKRSLVLSIKEKNKSDIESMEKQVVGINEGISGIQSQFDKLASSPWQGKD